MKTGQYYNVQRFKAGQFFKFSVDGKKYLITDIEPSSARTIFHYSYRNVTSIYEFKNDDLVIYFGENKVKK